MKQGPVQYSLQYLPVVVFLYSIEIKNIMSTVCTWFNTSFILHYLHFYIVGHHIYFALTFVPA
jgi:hypothetical protein